MQTYWYSPRRIALLLVLAVILLSVLAIILPSIRESLGRGVVTPENYARIKLGMSLEQAEDLLGAQRDGPCPWGEYFWVIWRRSEAAGDLEVAVVLDKPFTSGKVVGKWVRLIRTNQQGHSDIQLLCREGDGYWEWP
jgi:hypothetical protein